jgi:hypothetical protein
MSCKVKLGIPEKKMVAILVDIHLADGILMSKEFSVHEFDSAQVYTPILQKHGYTITDFREALNQYMKNPREFESVYNKVIQQLKNMQKQYASGDIHIENPNIRELEDREDIQIEERLQIEEGFKSKRELQGRDGVQGIEEFFHYDVSIVGDTIKVWW